MDISKIARQEAGQIRNESVIQIRTIEFSHKYAVRFD